MLSKIFSKDKVNTGRQKEIDLLRGFTGFFIIVCHVALYIGDNGDNALFVFGDIIGSEFGAPVFMLLMGISLVYTKHDTAKGYFIRGLKLFIAGYILNIVRSLIPHLILGDINWFSTVAALFVVDILPFAGLSFMFIGLCKKIKLPSYVILIISLVFAGIDQYIFTLGTLQISPFIGYFLNLLIPVTEYSCFPFLTWFFFVALGLCFGELLQRVKDKKRFYIILLIVGLLASAYVYGSFIYLYPNYTSYYAGGNFYYMGVINLLVNGLMTFLALSIWYFISLIIPKFLDNALCYLSKHLNEFYLLSWVIIAAVLHILTGLKIVLPTYAVIIVMIAIAVLNILCTIWVVNIKEKRTKND